MTLFSQANIFRRTKNVDGMELRMDQTFEWENRPRLVHEVANLLRDGIYSGHFAPGDYLRQVEISTLFKVSRTPIREAFRVLEQEGIVTKSNGGAVQVVKADTASLLDAYAMREVIDGLAAREATKRINIDALGHLNNLIDQQRTSISPWVPQNYTALNVQFHAAIIEIAQNKFLSRELPLVGMTSQVFTPSSSLNRDRAAMAIDEHIGIVAAIEAGDGQRAETVARLHIRTTMNHLEKRIEDQ